MAAEPLAAPGIDWPLGAVTRRRPRAHAAGGAGGGGAGLRGGARAAGGGGAGEAGGGRLPGRLSGLPPAPSRLLWLRPCADPRCGPLRPCPAARLPPGTPAASGAAQTHEARAPRRRCRRDGAPGPRGGAEYQCGSGIDSSGESAAGRVLHPGESRAPTRTGSRGGPPVLRSPSSKPLGICAPGLRICLASSIGLHTQLWPLRSPSRHSFCLLQALHPNLRAPRVHSGPYANILVQTPV